MHRKSHSVFGALKKTLETTNVYQKQSTTSKQATKQQHKHYKYPKIQKSKIPKIKNKKYAKIQNSKNTEIKKLQDSVDVKSLGYLDFLQSSSLPENCYGSMGKVCISACRRELYIYICMYVLQKGPLDPFSRE